MFSNKLSPAETERLALLMEECAEVQQIIGKILRHGYDSSSPLKPEDDNRLLLHKELGDVQAAIQIMRKEEDLDHAKIQRYKRAKLKRVGKFLHFNKVT